MKDILVLIMLQKSDVYIASLEYEGREAEPVEVRG